MYLKEELSIFTTNSLQMLLCTQIAFGRHDENFSVADPETVMVDMFALYEVEIITIS